jgi:hypothetical protein
MAFQNSNGLPVVFPAHIRVRVNNIDEHVKLHRALYDLGCGYVTAHPRLATLSPASIPCGHGLVVSTKGVIRVCLSNEEFESLSHHRELSLQIVTSKLSHETLITSIWGPTSWALMVQGNYKRTQFKSDQNAKARPATARKRKTGAAIRQKELTNA